MAYQIPQEIMIKSRYVNVMSTLWSQWMLIVLTFFLSPLYLLGLTLNNEASIFNKKEYYSAVPDAKVKTQSSWR